MLHRVRPGRQKVHLWKFFGEQDSFVTGKQLVASVKTLKMAGHNCATIAEGIL